MRQELEMLESEKQLEHFVKLWERYNIACNYITIVFSYLDRWYATRKDRLTIHSLIIFMFQNHIFSYYCDSIVNTMISIINKSRKFEKVNLLLIYDAVCVFIDLDAQPNELIFYKEKFQDRFITETIQFYDTIALNMLKSPNFTLEQYIHDVEILLQHERHRIRIILPHCSEIPLVSCTHATLLLKYQSDILGITPNDTIDTPVKDGSFIS